MMCLLLSRVRPQEDQSGKCRWPRPAQTAVAKFRRQKCAELVPLKYAARSAELLLPQARRRESPK